jgi:histidinol phosphatase-like enzyme (inositol monophosphatase family)
MLARRLADEARNVILPHVRNISGLEGKTGGRAGFDPVTAADRDAEQAIRGLLAIERPLDGITGEEFGETVSQSGWRWYIDPIDGTRAFIAGFPVWTILISLVDPDGEACIGVIDQPLLAERYIGDPSGTVLETASTTRQLRVSGQPDLRLATIATTDPFILAPPEQGAWNHLRSTARITRYGADAYAYARLAAGNIDLVAEAGLQPWDVAALIPVIRGAGGLVTDWAGRPARLGGQIVAAASSPLLDQALLALKRAAA